MIKHIQLLCCAVLICFNTYGQTSVQTIHDDVTQAQIRAYLGFLASDALQGRDTGSEGLQVAAQFIEAHLIAHQVDTMNGMDGYRQHVPFRSYTPPDSTFLMIGNIPLTFPDDYIVLNGKAGYLSSPIVYIGQGNEADIQAQDLRFKVAVSIAGDGVSNDPRDWIKISETKRKMVQKAGGLALIEIYQSRSVPWRFLRRFGQQSQTSLGENMSSNDLPNIWVGTQDSAVIMKLQTEEGHFKFFMDGVKRKSFYSDNVIGFIPGTDPELRKEYIVYSAHYDHIGIGNADATGDTIYNGARDNAVGATAVLRLAEFFAHHPPKRSSIFVFFTAEEMGLLGSKWFTNHLPVPAASIKYNFNIDNGGYNDTTIVSVIGLTRTEAEGAIQSACNDIGLTAIEDSAGEQGLFDRSDNVNFAIMGIPAPTFSLGFTSFDAEIFKYYHQAGDEIETLNMNYIEKYVKAYILSADRIANGVQTPFWNKGDKYYETGVKLYNRK